MSKKLIEAVKALKFPQSVCDTDKESARNNAVVEQCLLLIEQHAAPSAEVGDSIGSPVKYSDGSYSREYESQPEAQPAEHVDLLALHTIVRHLTGRVEGADELTDEIMTALLPYLRTPQALTPEQRDELVWDMAVACFGGYDESLRPAAEAALSVAEKRLLGKV